MGCRYRPRSNCEIRACTWGRFLPTRAMVLVLARSSRPGTALKSPEVAIANGKVACMRCRLQHELLSEWMILVPSYKSNGLCSK